MQQRSTAYLSVNVFIQMEFCPGENLQKYIETRAAPDRRHNLQIFSQLVEGVSSIHAKQIVHRDLKPQNIFLT